MVKKLVDAIKNLVIGLFTTGKHLGRHAVTLQYPKEKWQEMPERSRGIVVLLSDKETGKLNCTVCMLCQRACPTAAIRIEFEKVEKKRVLKDFIVDNTICCFCGLCEDTCNFAAIKMAPKYEFSTLSKEDLIWHRDKLQEMGRDVPYEKPVRKKKAVAKKPAEKTAGTAAKPKTTTGDETGKEKPKAQNGQTEAEKAKNETGRTETPKPDKVEPSKPEKPEPGGDDNKNKKDDSQATTESGESEKDSRKESK